MKTLLNGCSRSEFAVTPKNWNTQKASIRRQWKIHYRFYDPAFKNHPKYKGKKQVVIRRMNRYETLAERQVITKELIEVEMDLIDVKGYNPISGLYMTDQPTDPQPGTDSLPLQTNAEISPATPFIEALKLAVDKIDMENETRIDIASTLKYFGESASMLGKSQIPIKDIRRKDIRAILDNCKNLTVTRVVNMRVESNGKLVVVKEIKDGKKVPVKTEIVEPKIWTPNQFNHYLATLSMLYTEMVELEVVDYNPAKQIAKKEKETELRDVLTDEQRILIDRHLRNKVPTFHRYVHIFFHSGTRRTELLRVQGKDVDLPGQRFKILVKKGKKGTRRRWVWKTIKDIALPFWIEAMKNCGPEDYVFSEDLLPGVKMIRPEQITRRWRRHVKKDLGINVDFYSLKHLHTTEIRDIIGDSDTGAKEAAEHNSHTTTAMVETVYDIQNEQRKHQKVKHINNAFAACSENDLQEVEGLQEAV